MRLPYSIAVTLAFITCLSSFMLGLGQNDFLLPLLMFLAATASLYLTDFRRVIRLGDWTVNVLVLAIVFLTLGDIVRNRGEDLAFSIARVLVFVEMVLLFREKDPRFCWQILLISLLQVVVATVMQQSLLFGFLLIVYVFSGLCAFVLIFLQKENLYFRRHSFLNTFLDSLKAELAARQDRGRLVRIALITLFTGPLSLVFSFSPSDKSKHRIKPEADPGTNRWELLRSLFAVFPPENKRSPEEHWEMIGAPSKAWHESLWDEQTAVESRIEQDESEALSSRVLVPVPRFRPSRTGSRHRFPLLAERPAFSAGTMQMSGLEGGRRELFKHLVTGTLFALLVAVVLFCFIPRIGKIEFWGFTFNFGYDNWSQSFQLPVGTVGFKEEVRLGSLGSVMPYHREVISARLMKIPERRIPEHLSAPGLEVPYTEIKGASLYFRGIALENYANGVWTPVKDPSSNPGVFYGRRRSAPVVPDLGLSLQKNIYNARPGATVSPGSGDELFFEPGADLVCIHMSVRPLDTTVFFAPWPFFCRNDNDSRSLMFSGGSVNEIRDRNKMLSAILYSTAFKQGSQLALIPCQESVFQSTLRQIPDKGLSALVELARQWDEESGLPKTDFAGRARFMEQQFLSSDRFQYKLGGTIRDFTLDPLEDFIGKNPVGHCEYFAGALALMLRSVGIGSRVIVGFKTYAPETDGGEVTVRQSDAHAWVEAYLPPKNLQEQRQGPCASWWERGGWLRLDPTPSVNDQTIMKSVSFGLTDLVQWIQTLWSDYVLNMNSQKQTDWIYEPIRDGGHFAAERIFNVAFWKTAIPEIVRYYRSLLLDRKTGVWQFGDWLLLALPVLILAALLYLFHRLARLLWRHFRNGNGVRGKRKATVEFYLRMERLLAKAGRERRPNETPLEFIRLSGFESSVAMIVDAFYRVRFGGVVLANDELRDVSRCLDQLEKRMADHLSSSPTSSAS